MSYIDITPQMLEDAKPWPEGWHHVRFVEMKNEASKNKDSINFMPIFEALGNGQVGEGKLTSQYAALINNKNPKMFAVNMLPLVKAILGHDPQPGDRFDFDKAKGTPLWIEIKHKINEKTGQAQESIVGYSPEGTVPF